MAGYLSKVDQAPSDLYAAIWVKKDGEIADSRLYAGAPTVDHKTVYEALGKKGYEFQHSLQGFRGLDGQQKYCGVKSKAGNGSRLDTQQSPAEFDGKEYLDKIHWDVDPSNAPETPTTSKRSEQLLSVAEAKLNNNPKDLSAVFARGQAHFDLGHDEQAVVDFDLLIEKAPKGAGAYKYRAITHARLADGDAARADLQDFADRYSSPIANAYLNAVVSAYLDDDTEAMNRLESLIGQNPEDHRVLYDAACAYSIASGVFREKDFTKSKQYADRAIQLLQQAVAAGYKDNFHIREDADFDPIRERDDFIRLVGNLELSYASVWCESTRFESLESHGLPPKAHLAECQTMLADGYRLVSIGTASINGECVTASVWHRPLIPDVEKETLARRQANAAVAAFRMGRTERVWPLLHHSEDPRLRTWIIHRLNPLGASVDRVVKRLYEEPDASIRRALILSLGEYDETAQLDRGKLSTTLLELYRNDPDSGIHGAAEWVLRCWGKATELAEADAELSTGSIEGVREWYLSRQGHTMALIPGPVEFLMGSASAERNRVSNENLHWQRIGHSFVIATKEVTVGQFKEFLRQTPSVRHTSDEKYATEESCPQIAVTWYEAAAYCRWLSEQEGIADNQMCYPVVSEIKDGMKLPSDYLSRTGYRLPSEAEWEHACRSGANTSRYYGVADELLGQYAWFANTSGTRTWPVGSLKPNDRGLFDIYGNVEEWCQGRYVSYVGNLGSPSESQEDTVPLSDTGRFVMRGLSFASVSDSVRSARRSVHYTNDRANDRGIRIVRTYRISP